jgi:hypothetical protein
MRPVVDTRISNLAGSRPDTNVAEPSTLTMCPSTAAPWARRTPTNPRTGPGNLAQWTREGEPAE